MFFKKKVNISKMIDSIKEEEGFRGLQYNDHLGNPTIGFGTLLPLSEVEAELILTFRFEEMKDELYRNKPEIKNYPVEAQEILLEMMYQLGVPKLLQFQKMFNALDNKDFTRAGFEMLDSRWARQTPNRANRLHNRMVELAE